MDYFIKDKTLIITAAVGAALILILGIFFYLPARSEVSELSLELKMIQGEIEDIESFEEVEGKSVSEALDYLQEKFDGIFRMMPCQEENALKILSELANSLNIDIVSLRPGRKTPAMDKNGNPFKVENLTCFQLPISIFIRGRYKAIGEYAGQLRNRDFPILIKVNTIDIEKKESEAPRLDAYLDLNLYLLCES